MGSNSKISQKQIKANTAVCTIKYNRVSFQIDYFIDRWTIREIQSNLIDLVVNDLIDQRDLIDQQSKVIESLLLGFPPFSIIFQEEKDTQGWGDINSINQIIRGKYHLLCVLNFAQNNFQLNELQRLKELESLSFKDLDISIQKQFKKITIPAIAINKSEDLSLWEHFM